ncbi:MAG: hypothetical protein K2X66_13935 [Cyanobacteria bacterium]|nr:hypothetical protein [Cyanobacteriota bacterium]
MPFKISNRFSGRFTDVFTQSLKSIETLPVAKQQQIMYWVGGLSPLATNLVTPWVTYLRFKHSKLPEREKNFNVKQEIARQFVSAALQVTSFFGGAWLFGKMGGKNAKTMVEFLGGVLFAFLGYAFIRPMISSEIILRWLYPEESKAPTPPLAFQSSKNEGILSSTSPQALKMKKFESFYYHQLS